MANLLGALVAVVRSTNERFSPCVSRDIGRIFTVRAIGLNFECGPVVIDGQCPHCWGARAYMPADLQIIRGNEKTDESNTVAPVERDIAWG